MNESMMNQLIVYDDYMNQVLTYFILLDINSGLELPGFSHTCLEDLDYV